MELVKIGVAGTLESCDAAVTAEPLADGDRLVVVVETADGRYARRVRETAQAAASALGIRSGSITVRDRSALDCTIRARVLAACLRAAGQEDGAPETSVIWRLPS